MRKKDGLQLGSNPGPRHYEFAALTTWLTELLSWLIFKNIITNSRWDMLLIKVIKEA